MKKLILKTMMAAAVAMSMTGCLSPSSVDAGEEATLVHKPWFFGHGGVDQKPVATGQTWTWLSTEVIRTNIKPFNLDEVFDDLVTKDNNPVDFKLHLTFQAIEGQTPVLVEKFGNTTWYANKVREPLRNIVRSFTKNHKMFDMTTNAKVTDNLERTTKTAIQEFLLVNKIPVMLVNATVGKVMPPQAVITSTIQTAVQKQNVKTQQERVKAEGARELAETASAKADKAYMRAIGMNANQYLQMKELDNQKLAIESGSQVTIIMGGSSSPQPMFNVGGK